MLLKGLLLSASLLLVSIGYGQTTVSTLAGDGTAGFNDGLANVAQFNQLFGLYINANGDIFIGDDINHRVRQLSAGVVTTKAGSGTAGLQEGHVSTAQFNRALGITEDAGGNLYVIDSDNFRIRRIGTNDTVSTFVGTTSGFQDGPAASARFRDLLDLAIDASGNIYASDRLNHRIRRIDPAGNVTTFAGSGVPGNADGTGTSAQFNIPYGLDIDGAGNIYVADRNNASIRRISPAGVVTTIAGNGTQGFLDGPALSAQFNFPQDVAVDAAGRVFVADLNNHSIRMIESGTVSTIAGTGVAGYVDGTACLAQFRNPSLLVLFDNELYVTDRFNHRVRLISGLNDIENCNEDDDSSSDDSSSDDSSSDDSSSDDTSSDDSSSDDSSSDDSSSDDSSSDDSSSDDSSSGSNKTSVFPNPAQDELHLPVGTEELVIYNTMGSELIRKSNPARVFDISELSTGVYFLGVRGNEGKMSYKRIVVLR